MPKVKKSTAVDTESEKLAHETILGLRRPPPFVELSDKEKISVLCAQLKQLRNQFVSLRGDHHVLVQQFAKHKHLDGEVVLNLGDAYRHAHMLESGASEFDPLR